MKTAKISTGEMKIVIIGVLEGRRKERRNGKKLNSECLDMARWGK